ncbi:hypothetical protein RB594_002953 [Gaeumannomyces avenae]
MQQQNTNNASTGRKQTPGRRRPSRNTANSPAVPSHHRNYASENDAADLSRADAAFRKEMSDSPRTPRKSSPSAPHPSTNAKSRTGNKQRSKNATTSPIPVNSGRHTPPPTISMSAKAPSIAAFAGATFHASPAPSSLPIPSFMAKAMPDSPGAAGSRRPASQEPSPPPTDSEMPTPAPKSNAVGPSPKESPLDIFFRADRAEKEQARRSSSTNVPAPIFGHFSPPSQPLSPLRAGPSAAKDRSFQQGRPQVQRNTSIGSSPVDAGGSPTSGMGPAFSTPYYERIKAARSTDKQSRGAPEITPKQQQSVVDRSEALKNFLFAGQKQPSPAMTSSTAGASLLPAGARPPRSHTQNMYGAPYLHDTNDRRSANLRAFEDDLRRMLKLDSPLGLATKPPALTNAHTS